MMENIRSLSKFRSQELDAFWHTLHDKIFLVLEGM